jgi:hypothetical protein
LAVGWRVRYERIMHDRLRGKRARILLATARSNPEFALRVTHSLPEEERSRFVQELASTAPPAKPGLAKCRREPHPAVAPVPSVNLGLFGKRAVGVA